MRSPARRKGDGSVKDELMAIAAKMDSILDEIGDCRREIDWQRAKLAEHEELMRRLISDLENVFEEMGDVE